MVKILCRVGSFVPYFNDCFSRFGDRILWNDGTGNFPTDSPGAGQGRNVGLADLDDDGDLDVVLGVWRQGGGFGSFAVYMEAYRTESPGTFTQLDFPSSAETEFAIADFDGDGDLDVLNPRRTFMNQRRSMSQASIAGPGRPLDMALSGRANAYWRLFAAMSLGEPKTSVFGTYLLDEATVFLGRHGRFGPTGQETVRFMAPDNPALVGTTVYWQALIGAPPRWSSFEKTTFTAF